MQFHEFPGNARNAFVTNTIIASWLMAMIKAARPSATGRPADLSWWHKASIKAIIIHVFIYAELLFPVRAPDVKSATAVIINALHKRAILSSMKAPDLMQFRCTRDNRWYFYNNLFALSILTLSIDYLVSAFSRFSRYFTVANRDFGDQI